MKFMLDFNILFWYIIQCQLRNWHKKILNQKKLKKVLTLNIWFDILNLLTWKREQEWSLKTEQNVNSLLARNKQFKFQKKQYFFGEFDPGSGWTLAACLRHASRTKWPNNNGVLAQNLRWNFHLVADGWVTRG